MEIEEDYPELFSAISSGAAISYWPVFREFTLNYSRKDYIGIVLRYCPFSGKDLPSSLRDEWFDKIEELNIFPKGSVFDWDHPSIPKMMQTDQWWRLKY